MGGTCSKKKTKEDKLSPPPREVVAVETTTASRTTLPSSQRSKRNVHSGPDAAFYAWFNAEPTAKATPPKGASPSTPTKTEPKLRPPTKSSSRRKNKDAPPKPGDKFHDWFNPTRKPSKVWGGEATESARTAPTSTRDNTETRRSVRRVGSRHHLPPPVKPQPPATDRSRVYSSAFQKWFNPQSKRGTPASDSDGEDAETEVETVREEEGGMWKAADAVWDKEGSWLQGVRTGPDLPASVPVLSPPKRKPGAKPRRILKKQWKVGSQWPWQHRA